MNFEIAKITAPLDLGEYNEQYAGKLLKVWVNPPREVREKRIALLRDYTSWIRATVAGTAGKGQGLFGRKTRNLINKLFLKKKVDGADELQRRSVEWLAEILGQDDESPCSAQELMELHDVDQVLYDFIMRRAVEMIEQFRDEKKSPSKPPSSS